MRVLIAMAFGVLMAAFATMASAQAAPVGVWRGIGLQVDSGGKQSEWTIDLRIKADGSATVEYPSLKCGGTLAALPGGKYRETITHGDCVTGGTVGFVPMGGKLIWYWTTDQPDFRDVNATAVLFAAGVA
jgi:hypothetical protein